MKRALPGLVSLCMLAPLLAGACSLGPREEWADQIHAALDAARGPGNARVKMTSTIKVIETNIRQDPKPLLPTLQGVADFDDRRATLQGAKKTARVLFDDLEVYLPRSKSSVGESTKSWSSLDYVREPSEDIDTNDRRVAIGAGLISPVIALELLEGVLTGSIEKVGEGMKAGVQTTHYTANLSADAASIEVKDEDRREGLLRNFESLGIGEDLFPADVWIDEAGLVRGVRFVMRQQKDVVNAFKLVTSWEFFDYGEATAGSMIPSDRQTQEVRRIRDLIEDYIRESALNL